MMCCYIMEVVCLCCWVLVVCSVMAQPGSVARGLSASKLGILPCNELSFDGFVDGRKIIRG